MTGTAKKTKGKVDWLALVLVILTGAVLLFFAQRLYYRCAYPIKYNATVVRESESNDLPPSLVYAVIRTESSFNPAAQSHVGARGLMQITQDTFEWTRYRLGEAGEASFDVLYDGETNVRYGSALLRLLIDEFDTVENALCAYHAGWGNARKWLSDPDTSADGRNIDNIPFGDTSRYVKKVLETQDMYRELYGMR